MKQFIFTDYQKCHLDFPFVLRGVGIHHMQEPIHRPKGLPLYQWILCTAGRGNMILGGHEYEIQPGQGMFLHPDIGHSYSACDLPWTVHFITFDGFAVKQLLKNSPLANSGVFTLENPPAFEQYLDRVTAVPGDSTLVSCWSYSQLLYEMLLYLVLHTTGENGSAVTAGHHRLTPVIRYIENHFDTPLTLDELAGVCGLSGEYLCHLFKSTIGVRIFDYINQVRIRHSKEMLLEMKEFPARTVGLLCGFDDASYFGKTFKRYEGMTPGEFRSIHGL